LQGSEINVDCWNFRHESLLQIFAVLLAGRAGFSEAGAGATAGAAIAGRTAEAATLGWSLARLSDTRIEKLDTRR
jgi:hypothetical protein